MFFYICNMYDAPDNIFSVQITFSKGSLEIFLVLRSLCRTRPWKYFQCQDQFEEMVPGNILSAKITLSNGTLVAFLVLWSLCRTWLRSLSFANTWCLCVWNLVWVFFCCDIFTKLFLLCVFCISWLTYFYNLQSFCGLKSTKFYWNPHRPNVWRIVKEIGKV